MPRETRMAAPVSFIRLFAGAAPDRLRAANLGRRGDIPAQFLRRLSNVFLSLLLDKAGIVFVTSRWRVSAWNINDTNPNFVADAKIRLDPLQMFASFADATAKTAYGELQPGSLGVRDSLLGPL